MPQTLAEPLGVIPAGAVGQVLTVGPTGALVRFQGKYPATPINLRDLERASYIDLLPVAARPVTRRLGGWLGAGLGVALVAVITLLVERIVIHFFGK